MCSSGLFIYVFNVTIFCARREFSQRATVSPGKTSYCRNILIQWQDGRVQFEDVATSNFSFPLFPGEGTLRLGKENSPSALFRSEITNTISTCPFYQLQLPCHTVQPRLTAEDLSRSRFGIQRRITISFEHKILTSPI